MSLARGISWGLVLIHLAWCFLLLFLWQQLGYAEKRVWVVDPSELDQLLAVCRNVLQPAIILSIVTCSLLIAVLVLGSRGRKR